MAKSDNVEKRKLYVTIPASVTSTKLSKLALAAGEIELPGLVNMSEAPIQYGEVEIPGIDSIVPYRNGVKTIPGIDAVFKGVADAAVNVTTIDLLEAWFDDGITLDCRLDRVDAVNISKAEQSWTNVELSKLHIPAYDASSPTYFQILVRFLPENIISIAK
jgi:hypothetical protein